MVVSLSGDNDFGRAQALKQLVTDFEREYGNFGLERLDGEEADYDQIEGALNSLPFLVERKMVVLYRPGANKQFVEKAEALLTNLAPVIDVVIVEPELDKRTSYYKLLKNVTDFKEFNQLDAVSLSRWLVQEAKTAQAVLSLNDANYLIERLGTNQQLLYSELQKLAQYSPTISRASIDLLTDRTPQSTIFQLLEAAFSGQTAQLLNIYNEQRAQKVEPAQIIAMLTWQLHILALIKTAGDRSVEDIAKEAKLNPFVVRKSQAIAKDLSLRRLKEIISQLVELDTKLKSQTIEADEALQLFLLTLAN